jgi:hypothetical protein
MLNKSFTAAFAVLAVVTLLGGCRTPTDEPEEVAVEEAEQASEMKPTAVIILEPRGKGTEDAVDPDEPLAWKVGPVPVLQTVDPDNSIFTGNPPRCVLRKDFMGVDMETSPFCEWIKNVAGHERRRVNKIELTKDDLLITIECAEREVVWKAKDTADTSKDCMSGDRKLKPGEIPTGEKENTIPVELDGLVIEGFNHIDPQGTPEEAKFLEMNTAWDDETGAGQ